MTTVIDGSAASDHAAGLLAAAVSASVLLAGCLGTVPSDPPDGRGIPSDGGTWARNVLSDGDDHDHWDRDQHRGRSTTNFELLGFDPLITDHDGRTTGDHTKADVEEADGRRLAVVQSQYWDVGFLLVDLTDPSDPDVVGEFVMQNTNVYDVQLGPDLEYLAIGTWPYDSGPDQQDPPGERQEAILTYRPHGGDAALVTGPEDGPYYNGAILVDIADPDRPEVQDYRPHPPLGGHNVRLQRLGDRLIFAVSALDATRKTSYYAFHEVVEVAGTAKLVPLSVYNYDLDQRPGNAPATYLVDGQFGAHDLYMQEHPVTGGTLAYLAAAGNGLVIVDIGDPRDPRFVSQWNRWSDLFGNHGDRVFGSHVTHTALPISGTWDGKHYTILGQECHGAPADAPTCYLAVLDTTDPADPSFVGYWTLPEMVTFETNLQYSVHWIALDEDTRTLYVAVHHAGVWAIDLSTPQDVEEMPSVGAFLPTGASPSPPPDSGRSVVADTVAPDLGRPDVPDVDIASDGTLVVLEPTSGLYTVRFDASNPAPEALPWPVGPRAP